MRDIEANVVVVVLSGAATVEFADGQPALRRCGRCANHCARSTSPVRRGGQRTTAVAALRPNS